MKRFLFFSHYSNQLLNRDHFVTTIISNTYEFDISALIETWLKDNHHQLVWVEILGYLSICKNVKGKKGDGVGFYINPFSTVHLGKLY